LGVEELRAYAEQYRHFEECLPNVLSKVVVQTAGGPCGDRVKGNLDDELAHPRPHLELFEAFATEVAARAYVPPTRATSALVDLFQRAAHGGPIPALSVIAAYEIQAGAIAATKAAALSEHYHLSGPGTEFWTVHGDMEAEHAAWSTEALELLGASPVTVQAWARRSATRWWDFLDERELDRAA
jgi:pyrroloquinoline quinone (PQQ) biosynthesis protein C